ncbi:MAG: sulfotransferase domain-containing protein [Cyanobacteria bacterium J06631_2]
MSAVNSYGVFVHGLHKSASMFLYKIFRDLAEEAGIDYYSSNYKLAGTNKLQPNQKDLRRVTKSSFCYCPVRHFARSPEAMPPQKPEWGDRPFIVYDDFPNIDRIYRIYQIRDPRDILVSEYFSFGFIHFGRKQTSARKQQIQNMTIDEYCLEYADKLLDRYQSILPIAAGNSPDRLIVKYETMVLDYKSWLSQVMKPFQFELPETEVLEKYYQKYKHEFNTEGFEESMKHKRKMIPGDHKEKLQESTIKTLNDKFSAILDRFYALKTA